MPKNSVRPSKYGCFTCRARRVKCDEIKPSCARCDLAKRKCEGYPDNAPVETPNSGEIIQASAFDKPAHPVGFETATIFYLHPKKASGERGRLIQLACHILAWDLFKVRTSQDIHLWSKILPQMSSAHSLVGTAVAAFGAAYEAQVIRRGQQQYEVALATQYQNGISELSKHIEAQSTALLPILLACTMLAALETVRRNQGDALTHAQGAFELWEHYSSKHPDSEIQHTLDTTQASGVLHLQQELSSRICCNMDLMITSYAQDRTPVLPSITSGPSDDTFVSIDQAALVLRDIMHASLGFTSKMAQFRYKALKYHPPHLIIEQGRHLSRISCWLLGFRAVSKDQSSASQPSQNAECATAAVLEAQCLTEWIRVSSIHSPHETFYDNYISEFLQILRCVESVLAKKSPYSPSLTSYSPVPGIIPSLRLAAIKCRHQQIRRRAIELLQVAGIEGPWHGNVEAAIVRRIVEVEQCGLLWLHAPSNLSEVHERDRVCYHNVQHESFENHGLTHRMTIEFAQCADIDALISDQGEDGNNKSRLWTIWQEELVIE